MSKVTLHFQLLAPLDETMSKAIARAGGIYGLERVSLNRAMDGLLVDYDASRLNREEVEAVLGELGLPLARVVVETADGVLAG
ncbi:MAG: hypothetical protein IT169_19265 [Bryobacterales bacterium]|nr:hypothetical protein [Bryobacterales bacterium]